MTKYNNQPVICMPLEKLLQQRRTPALFIGAGFSKRYLIDYMDWTELLYSIGNKLNVDNFRIDSLYKKYINENYTEGQAKQKIGSFLRDILDDIIAKGNASLVFSSNEIEEIQTKKLLPFNYLVSQLMPQNLTFRSFEGNSYLQTEINFFKQLEDKVPCIITTNYDKLIEHLFNNKYQTYTEQSDYFYAFSSLNAEIYKIHGSLDKPNTMVITQEDYNSYEEKAYLSTAKLLNILCERPIIFIGYSLSDENIRSVLEKLINCLNQEQLLLLQNNLLFIDWKPHVRSMAYNTHTITLGNKTLDLTYISTDNYTRLYQYLNKFKPMVSARELRKFNSTINNLIIKNNAQLKTIIGKYDDLLNLPEDTEIAITAVGPNSEGYGKIPVDKIILDVLFRKGEYSCKNMLESWFTNNYSVRTNAPLFYYKKQCDKEKIVLSDRVKEKFREYQKDKRTTKLTCPVKLQSKTLRDLDKETIKLQEKILIIMNLYENSKLTIFETETQLQNLYNDNNEILAFSEFKKAVVILDRDSYRNKK